MMPDGNPFEDSHSDDGTVDIEHTYNNNASMMITSVTGRSEFDITNAANIELPDLTEEENSHLQNTIEFAADANKELSSQALRVQSQLGKEQAVPTPVGIEATNQPSKEQFGLKNEIFKKSKELYDSTSNWPEESILKLSTHAVSYSLRTRSISAMFADANGFVYYMRACYRQMVKIEDLPQQWFPEVEFLAQLQPHERQWFAVAMGEPHPQSYVLSRMTGCSPADIQLLFNLGPRKEQKHVDDSRFICSGVGDFISLLKNFIHQLNELYVDNPAAFDRVYSTTITSKSWGIKMEKTISTLWKTSDGMTAATDIMRAKWRHHNNDKFRNLVEGMMQKYDRFPTKPLTIAYIMMCNQRRVSINKNLALEHCRFVKSAITHSTELVSQITGKRKGADDKSDRRAKKPRTAKGPKSNTQLRRSGALGDTDENAGAASRVPIRGTRDRSRGGNGNSSNTSLSNDASPIGMLGRGTQEPAHHDRTNRNSPIVDREDTPPPATPEEYDSNFVETLQTSPAGIAQEAEANVLPPPRAGPEQIGDDVQTDNASIGTVIRETNTVDGQTDVERAEAAKSSTASHGFVVSDRDDNTVSTGSTTTADPTRGDPLILLSQPSTQTNDGSDTRELPTHTRVNGQYGVTLSSKGTQTDPEDLPSQTALGVTTTSMASSQKAISPPNQHGPYHRHRDESIGHDDQFPSDVDQGDMRPRQNETHTEQGMEPTVIQRQVTDGPGRGTQDSVMTGTIDATVLLPPQTTALFSESEAIQGLRRMIKHHGNVGPTPLIPEMYIRLLEDWDSNNFPPPLPQEDLVTNPEKGPYFYDSDERHVTYEILEEWNARFQSNGGRTANLHPDSWTEAPRERVMSNCILDDMHPKTQMRNLLQTTAIIDASISRQSPFRFKLTAIQSAGYFSNWAVGRHCGSVLIRVLHHSKNRDADPSTPSYLGVFHARKGSTVRNDIARCQFYQYSEFPRSTSPHIGDANIEVSVLTAGQTILLPGNWPFATVALGNVAIQYEEVVTEDNLEASLREFQDNIGIAMMKDYEQLRETLHYQCDNMFAFVTSLNKQLGFEKATRYGDETTLTRTTNFDKTTRTIQEFVTWYEQWKHRHQLHEFDRGSRPAVMNRASTKPVIGSDSRNTAKANAVGPGGGETELPIKGSFGSKQRRAELRFEKRNAELEDDFDY